MGVTTQKEYVDSPKADMLVNHTAEPMEPKPALKPTEDQKPPEVIHTLKFLEPCTFSFTTPEQQPYGGGSHLYY